MNRKLLQKVIDELVKEKPDLSYIRGILETMLESLPEDKPLIPSKGIIMSPSNLPSSNPIDEAAVLDAKAKAALEIIKGMEKPQ